MKRIIVLASLAAFMVALPAAHLAAAPQNEGAEFCVTGKNKDTGHVISIPSAVADRLEKKGIGSACFKPRPDTNECVLLPKKKGRPCGGKKVV